MTIRKALFKGVITVFFFKIPLMYLFLFFILFYFFKDFFLLMWTAFKVFIEFVTILFPFHVLVFGRQACGYLVPQPGKEPVPPALGSKVLTTGPPGMSLCIYF